MEVFFNKIDTEIEKKIQRDPLGEEEIWTSFANILFPRVNSVTDELKGYVIAAIIKDIMEKRGIANNNKINLQVSCEMIIMFLMIRKNIELNKDVSFLGKNNGNAIIKEMKQTNQKMILKRTNEPQKNEINEILVRQNQLGYYGRYHSKIDNIFEEILNIVFDNEQTKNDVEKWLIEKCNRIISSDGLKYENIFLKNTNIDILFEILQLKDEKKNKKILDILEIENNTDIKELYNIIKKSNEPDTEKIINDVILELTKKTSNNKLKNLLEYIKDLENFFIELENIFYELLSKNRKSIKDINNSCKKLYEISIRLNDFRNNDIIKNNYYNIISKNYNTLIRNLDKDKETIINSLINVHNEIMNKRDKKPWVQISNGIIYVNHFVNRDYTEYEWKHDYYINNVYNIIRSTNQWE